MAMIDQTTRGHTCAHARLRSSSCSSVRAHEHMCAGGAAFFVWCGLVHLPAPSCVAYRFLRRTFGVIPRVGWQIDPFGHSATQASSASGLHLPPLTSVAVNYYVPTLLQRAAHPLTQHSCRPCAQAGLLSAQVGFDAFFFGRADYQASRALLLL